jgi:hypothetical protein
MNQKANTSVSDLNVIKDILIGADLQMIQEKFETMLKTIQDLEKNQELLLKNMEVNFDKRLQVLENEVNSKEIILMNKIKEERTNLSSLLSNISSKLNED